VRKRSRSSAMGKSRDWRSPSAPARAHALELSLHQVARFAAPNLVLGNTIVRKLRAQCPESAAL